jgi:uncharacterized protein YecE (DUF72 family)
MTQFIVGTCSWKYPSWEGLVYSSREPSNYLAEYATKYGTVEVDQWFWSLGKEAASLPRPEVVAEYDASTPKDFTFSIKAPNALTLTHHPGVKGEPRLNARFLDPEFFLKFIDSLSVLMPKVGLIVFQFSYFNRQKMPSRGAFIELLRKFFRLFSFSREI